MCDLATRTWGGNAEFWSLPKYSSYIVITFPLTCRKFHYSSWSYFWYLYSRTVKIADFLSPHTCITSRVGRPNVWANSKSQSVNNDVSSSRDTASTQLQREISTQLSFMERPTAKMKDEIRGRPKRTIEPHQIRLESQEYDVDVIIIRSTWSGSKQKGTREE